MARYRIHMLDGSHRDVDALTAAEARARFDNRGIARVKIIRGEATPAEIEARLSAASRRRIWPFTFAMLLVALPSIIQIIGG